MKKKILFILAIFFGFLAIFFHSGNNSSSSPSMNINQSKILTTAPAPIAPGSNQKHYKAIGKKQGKENPKAIIIKIDFFFLSSFSSHKQTNKQTNKQLSHSFIRQCTDPREPSEKLLCGISS